MEARGAGEEEDVGLGGLACRGRRLKGDGIALVIAPLAAAAAAANGASSALSFSTGSFDDVSGTVHGLLVGRVGAHEERGSVSKFGW